MYSTLTKLIDKLDNLDTSSTNVISWGCPVPSFGALSRANVATLGLNPSNLEFMDNAGNELQGPSRRFHTLRSLGLSSWSEADVRHIRMIIMSCEEYFVRNPYDRWFRRLNSILSGVGASYYDSIFQSSFIEVTACHLDLIPYATSRKWGELTPVQRSSLLHFSGDTLVRLLRDSSIRLLILNGQSVVNCFQDVAGSTLQKQELRDLSLPRKSSRDVRGLAYSGVLDRISGVDLDHQIVVLGFNHNIQSSFGVTAGVVAAIRDWISQVSIPPQS